MKPKTRKVRLKKYDYKALWFEDSERLRELRAAIDAHLGWASFEEEENGDYVARVQQIGRLLAAVYDIRAARKELVE